MIVVRRLRHGPKGSPYLIETKVVHDMDAMQELASKWWESGGTAAMTVEQGPDVNSLTIKNNWQKGWLKEEQVPKSWPLRKESDAPPAARKRPERVLSLGEESKAPREVKEGMCPLCLKPIKDYNSLSPSDRLARLQCAMCGADCHEVPRVELDRRFVMWLQRGG